MQHAHASFCFNIGFVLSGNSSVTLAYTREKGACTMTINIGTKVVVKAYKCISTRDDENVITYCRGFS